MMLFDVAGDPETQFALEVIRTVTVSPAANALVVYSVLSVPTVFFPIYHWYEGVGPPLVGLAVKVTEVPRQIELFTALDWIDTLAGNVAFTVVIIVSDTAGDPLTQAKSEVITTVTESLSAKVEVV